MAGAAAVVRRLIRRHPDDRARRDAPTVPPAPRTRALRAPVQTPHQRRHVAKAVSRRNRARRSIAGATRGFGRVGPPRASPRRSLGWRTQRARWLAAGGLAPPAPAASGQRVAPPGADPSDRAGAAAALLSRSEWRRGRRPSSCEKGAQWLLIPSRVCACRRRRPAWRSSRCWRWPFHLIRRARRCRARRAASPSGGGGFSRFVEFINRLQLTDPDRQRVLRARAGLGRPAVPGGRPARGARARIRRSRARHRAAVQADRRVMRRPAARIRPSCRRARCERRAGLPPARPGGDPHSRRAALGIPNPFDLGLPGPTDLIGELFEFFFKTFFGIEAKVTQRAVDVAAGHTGLHRRHARTAQLNQFAIEPRRGGVGAVGVGVHGRRGALLRVGVHQRRLLRGDRSAHPRRRGRRRARAVPAGRSGR